MKTEKIEKAIMIVRQVAEVGLAGKGLEYDALKFIDTAHAACAELAALKEENERLRKAQREVMEKCLTYIETAWLDKDGMLIAVDGKDFLDDVRSTLIEQLGKEE